jgi:SNF2 family DNA or RNA helicase
MTLPALWAHQAKAVDFGNSNRDVGLFFQIGTGKSRTAIDIVRWECARLQALQKILIFAPKIVCTNWKREFLKYSKIADRDIVVLTGSGTKRFEQLKAAILTEGMPDKAKVIITNYEAVEMEKVYDLLLAWKPDIIIADEAHRLKSPESKRAKKVVRIGDTARRRLALTGTPILNSAMDIFMIFRFLDMGETFGLNFWKFRNTWFQDANARWSGKPGYFPKWEPRPEAYAEFSTMIGKKALRALKSECLDLPPLVRKEVHVEMGPEQKRLYDDMREKFIAYVDDLEKTATPRAVVAQLAITKALRLLQLITGFAKTDDGEIHRIEKNPRLDALKELLEEHAADHKIIVWSVFHENYKDIAKVCQDLGLGYRELHGKVAGKERDGNIHAFCNDPSVRVLVANQAAGGIGINLVESDISIFYSKNFSLEQDLQAEGRNYRGGSEMHRSVVRIDIVTTGSIDDLVCSALALKQSIGTKILDWKTQL